MGYLLVSAALTLDVGQPWRMWHPLVMWNPHPVMFEVAWCVMLYTGVLAIEFSPMVFERLGWQRPLRVVRSLGALCGTRCRANAWKGPRGFNRQCQALRAPIQGPPNIQRLSIPAPKLAALRARTAAGRGGGETGGTGVKCLRGL
jgi:hypothetical protein